MKAGQGRALTNPTLVVMLLALCHVRSRDVLSVRSTEWGSVSEILGGWVSKPPPPILGVFWG